MTMTLIAILFSLAASAFCSVSEAAFYSYPRSTAEHLANSGSRSGRYLLDIKNNMERYIASVLIVNTLANTLGVFWATRTASEYLNHTQQLALPWILAVLILLFGEIMPKTIGVRKARQVGPFVAFIFFYLTKLLSWTGLIWFCVRLTRRLTGEKTQEFTRDDIKSLADIGVREGIIDAQQAQVMKNILSLKTMTVRSVMTPRQVVFTLPAETTIQDCIQERGNWPFSRVPVHGSRKDHWMGQVLRRDAYNALVDGRGSQPLRKFIRPLQMIPDSMSVDALLHKFLKQRAHMVGVVDEYGSVAGIATLEDVLEGLLGREIVDEFDETIDLQEQARSNSLALAAIKLNDEERP